MRALIAQLQQQLKTLDAQVSQLEHIIASAAQPGSVEQRLQQVPGIGPITSSAVVASVGDARLFANGRQLAAWLGLVPRQHSSGGKDRLLGISKRGDVYLRTLLIHGARALVRLAQMHPERYAWLHGLIKRSNANVAAVALANKNARMAWALMAHGTSYRPQPTGAAA